MNSLKECLNSMLNKVKYGKIQAEKDSEEYARLVKEYKEGIK